METIDFNVLLLYGKEKTLLKYKHVIAHLKCFTYIDFSLITLENKWKNMEYCVINLFRKGSY